MNHSLKNEAKVPQPPSKEFLGVLRKHLAIFAEHYRQPISELSVMAYAEDLSELSPQELHTACLECRKSSLFMPVSAAILKSYRESKLNPSTVVSGPPLLQYPAISAEDREEALRYSENLKRTLDGWKKEKRVSTSQAFVANTSPEFELTLTAYRKWLTEQFDQDKRNMANGISLPPRSQEELDAIISNLPATERRQARNMYSLYLQGKPRKRP